jgi:hypothetical protein
MKKGLNMTDINVLKRGIEAGLSHREIATACATSEEVIDRYVASMNKPKAAPAEPVVATPKKKKKKAAA